MAIVKPLTAEVNTQINMKKNKARIGILTGTEMPPHWENMLLCWGKMFSEEFAMDLITNIDVPGDLRVHYNVRNFVSPLKAKQTTKELRKVGYFPNIDYLKLFSSNLRFAHRAMKDFINCHRYVKDKKPDLLFHVGMPETYGVIIGVIGKLHGIRTIARNSGDFLNEWRVVDGYARKISHYLKFTVFSSICFRLVDKVICQGPILANKLAEKGINSQKIEVIPQPIDQDRFCAPHSREYFKQRAGIPLDKKMILFVGRLEIRKGLEILLSVIEAVSEHRSNFVFCVIGEGPYRRELERFGKEYVRLEGKVLPEQIDRYYKAADLFIFPSLTEGLPNVVLEAMSCKVPVIASGAGDIPSYCSNIFKEPQEYVDHILTEKWTPDSMPTELLWDNIKERYKMLFCCKEEERTDETSR